MIVLDPTIQTIFSAAILGGCCGSLLGLGGTFVASLMIMWATDKRKKKNIAASMIATKENRRGKNESSGV